ncbi:MAG: alpha/beta hydrolase [Spirochaetes bacterium]|nr:MAG: alpha/beta hydrolase [Spirochaetota bacterium]
MKSSMKYIEMKSGRVAYRCFGSGEPALLFLHGAGGDHRLFLHQLAFFKESYRSIAVDLPAHGESAWNGMPTIEDYVTAVEAVLDHEGVTRVVPVGHSMGGGIMFELCLRKPERVSRMIALCTAATLPVNSAVFQLIDQDYAAFCDFAVKLSYSREVSPETAALALQGMSATDPATMRNDFTICASYDYSGSLDRITWPSLVLTTRSDKLVPRALAESLATALPDAKLVVLEATGHMPHMEHHEKVNGAIREFLDAAV